MHTCVNGGAATASSLLLSAVATGGGGTTMEGLGDATDPFLEAVEFFLVRVLDRRSTEFRSKCCLRNCMSSDEAAAPRLAFCEGVTLWFGSVIAEGFLRSVPGNRPLFVVLVATTAAGKGLFLVGRGGGCGLLFLWSSAWL